MGEKGMEMALLLATLAERFSNINYYAHKIQINIRLKDTNQ